MGNDSSSFGRTSKVVLQNPKEPERKIRVFLADDHKLICDTLVGYLDREPALEVVGTAHTGGEALTQIEQLSPDIALLDFSMPDLNGIEVTKKLLEAGRQTRVVLVTMHSDSDTVASALSAGVRGYVLKSLGAEELLRAIEVVSKNEVYLSPSLLSDVVSSYLELRSEREKESPLSVLSDREREVLRMQAEGISTRDIALQLHLSPKTVETYKYRIKSKLDITDNASLVKLAIRCKLVTLG